MPYMLAVAGKGGTGKTTFAALAIRNLIGAGRRNILAVDADPNANLADLLGLEMPPTVADIIDETKGLREMPGGMTKDRYLEYRVQTAVSEGSEVDLLVMGRPEGKGCYCFANSVLRRAMEGLTESYAYLVLDNEAGMEHLSRHTTNDVDVLFILSDPSLVGVRSAIRIRDIARELELQIKDVRLVINRAPESLPDRLLTVIEGAGLALAGTVPPSDEIRDYELEARPLLAMPLETPAPAAVRAILVGAGALAADDVTTVRSEQ
jgi:CO dehydrogenase maturation factor